MDRTIIISCINEAIHEGNTRGMFRYKYILNKLRKIGIFTDPKEELETMVREGLLSKPEICDQEQYCITDKWFG